MSLPDTQSTDGSRYSVTGTDNRLNLDLPTAETKRWSPRRKAAVVIAVRNGTIARTEACERYALSEEELAEWEVAFDRRGIPGLRSGFRNSYTRRPNKMPAQPVPHELE
jgi:hypothetical protein